MHGARLISGRKTIAMSSSQPSGHAVRPMGLRARLALLVLVLQEGTIKQQFVTFGEPVPSQAAHVERANIRDEASGRVDLPRLLKESDFVSVHVPETPATINLFDDERFALMKPTATGVETASSPGSAARRLCRFASA